MACKENVRLVAAIMVFGIFGAGCNDSETVEKTPATDSSKVAVQAESAQPATPKAVAKPVAAKAETAAPATESSWLNEYFGDELVLADGSKVTVSTLKGKTIGIYFSAHWCPPCRAFTPVLVKTFNAWQKDGKSIDIVFVSSDQNEKSMANYMEEMKMPWKGLPFGSAKKEALAQKYGVRGIPTLVIVDKDGKTITTQGRMDVATKGTAAFEAWVK